MTIDTLSAALEWAARGFRVFPLMPGIKDPAVDDWPNVATNDPDRIRELWGTRPFNVGVSTDNMIVVDVDDKPGKTGTASFLDLGLDFNSLVVRTPSGGHHVYFDGPNRGNSASKLGSGIDIRSWHGYVIAPGSWLDINRPENKGSGGFYTLDNDLPLAPAPAHLIARLDEPRERQSALPVVDLDTPQAILRAVDYLEREAPLAIEGDGGDHTTFVVAATLKDIGISQDSTFAMLAERWNERCYPPWSLDELKVKVENAFAYGTLAPGAASSAVYVAGLHIDPPRYVQAQTGKWLRHGDEWRSNVRWLYYNTLPEVGLATLIAPTGAGKTFLALHLAQSLAKGLPFFGIEPDEPGGTALLVGEGRGGILMRMAALEEPGRLPIYACPVGVLSQNGALAALEAEIRVAAEQMKLDFNMRLRLLVLDTLSASAILEDENDNAQAAIVMKALDAMAGRLGVLLIIVHHPPKMGRGERGAGAIRANVEVQMEIFREGKSAVRELEITKAREAYERSLGSFTLIPVRLGVDEKGREIVSCKVAPAAGVTRSMPATAHTELFMECVEWALEEKGGIISGEHSVEQMHIEEVFEERFPGVRKRASIDKAFKAAIIWAETAGMVKVIPFGGRRYVSPLSAMLTN